jgi:transketolase
MSNVSSATTCSIDDICINTLRTLAMDAIQKANSGHPGAPMGLAAAAYILWTRTLRHNPKNPNWPNRDRFILSSGHASMLLYGLLHMTGYGLSLEDIKSFRQLGSKTPGHPEYGHTTGVETTTGPLGQGLANGVGMAMAECHLAARFNQPEFNLVDHYTYVMCGDGDLMEGLTAEAASFAGHLKLGKLICLYDDNEISIEGKTDITFTEDVGARFTAYGWQVIKVEDGNDIVAIEKALETAKSENTRPSLIVLATHIAFGSPNKQDTADAHGAPLGEEEICLTKANLGCPPNEKFCVPADTNDMKANVLTKGAADEAAWNKQLSAYSENHPQLAAGFKAALAGELPSDWESAVPVFSDEDSPLATRAASGRVLNGIAGAIPEIMGGSADLAPSNKTIIDASHDFQSGQYDGRNIRFGVREHAMGAILTGMALHKGVRPYGGTFLVFADYMRPAIRLAALMKLPVVYVFTHDSIAVGEDGPTHQPVEHLAALRAIPGLTVIRPADAVETAAAWRMAMTISDGPVALILSRQKLPISNFDSQAVYKGLEKGAYIVADTKGTPDLVIMATGSEVHIAIEAKNMLAEKKIAARVVSMPSWELFEKTPADYREKVLPSAIQKRISVEAGINMGWERYVGSAGAVIGINHFGASAPGGLLLEKFGFTAENIVAKAERIMAGK